MRKRFYIISVCAVVLLLLLEAGNVVFYSTWVTCGSKPVVADNSLHIDASQPKWYGEASNLDLFRSMRTYFCTPLDAERAGYSASSTEYIFPNLEKR